MLLAEDGDDRRAIHHDHFGSPCSSYPRISSGLRPVSARAAYRLSIFINCAAMRSGRRCRRSRASRSRKARVTAEVKLSPVRSASSVASLWASSFLMLRCMAFFMVEIYTISTIDARRFEAPRRNAHRQGLDAAHKAGIDPLRFADHLDPVEPLQHLLPYDLQLQLGKPHADAAVDAEAERQMGAGPGAVDDEVVGVLDALFVAIAGDVPHHHPVALADFLVSDFGIDQRGAPHMRQWRLPANDFRHHRIDQ